MPSHFLQILINKIFINNGRGNFSIFRKLKILARYTIMKTLLYKNFLQNHSFNKEKFNWFRTGIFSENKHFQISNSRSSLKKKEKKITIVFSVNQNWKTKKFAISKISNKKFRKIHYFANIKYKRKSQKYCDKNFRRNIFVKRKVFAKKKSLINICRKKFS